LKGIEGTSSSVIKRAAKKSKGQSDRFIFDISKESITTKEAIRQIKEDLFKSTDTAFVDTALLIKDSTIISIFKRI